MVTLYGELQLESVPVDKMEETVP
ncbi:hypothetical protein CI238_13450 [Colletotrichum incanum]|uniref:Uncharacterized protein n=1 Tax=Colletotrichum incanum TaxID=1573173 RepID=A0A162NP14_COLIC|nr:hypothetical protein CI238_13450 [Colletotrichum incanum]